MLQLKKLLKRGHRITPQEAAFERLESAESWKSFVFLVYGPPGVGKTWLVGTASQVESMCPVLLLDNDGGSRTIRGKEQFKGVTIYRIYSFEAYNAIFAEISQDPTKYKTVVIDNLGAMYEHIMEAEMEAVCAGDQSRDSEVPSRREYMIARGITKKIVKFFSELSECGVNVIFTCHAEIDKDDLLKTTLIRPALPGKLSFEIPGVLPIVGYLITERPNVLKSKVSRKEMLGVTRTLYFEAPKMEAKDQSSLLGASISNPTMKQFNELLNSK